MHDQAARPATPSAPLRVGLFSTCLADLFRPNICFAAVKLLEDAGCIVEVPASQTCCAQPAYNSGDARDARAIAAQVIATFEEFEYVVAPSGSCIGTIREHYPNLFAHDEQWRGRVERLVGRCYELITFMTEVLGVEAVNAAYPATVTYHDSCSGLRELGIRNQPRKLLASVGGLTLKEMNSAEVCCGFGGTFCVKYPEISGRMVSDKVSSIHATGADTVLGGDFSCLMNIAGRLKRTGSRVKAYHVAEVLAGMTDTPAIGEGEDSK